MDYERPRQRARTFGIGLLTGGGLMDNDTFNQIQNNVQFRLQSAREVLAGVRQESGMSPLDRRRQIRQNRMQMLGMSDGESPMTGGRGGGGSSGSIGERSRGQEGTASSVQSSTPSMSEVDRGTKKRAEDRGFTD